MPSYNKVMIMGNLTREPEVRYTPKGSAVCDLSMAVNRKYTTESGEKKEEVTYVDVTLWGKLAELASKHVSKGDPLFVEGRLQMESWEDKQTGQKRSKMRVVGELMQFLGRKHDDSQRPASAPSQRQTRDNRGGHGPSPFDEEAPLNDDDIPF